MDFLVGIALFLCGIAIGILATLFGIGGAIVAIPLFHIFLGLPGNMAIATALPLTIPTALSGTIQFSRYNLIKYKTAILGGMAGIVFSIIGALSTQYFSGAVLMISLGVLLFLAALITLKTKNIDERESETAPLKEKIVVTASIGAFVGFVSGFFGIGGGTLLVPLLMAFRKISIKRAVATSLLMIAVYSVPGAITHYFLGNVDLVVLGIAVTGSVVGTKIGATYSHKMAGNTQRNLLVLALVFFGLLLVFNEAMIR